MERTLPEITALWEERGTRLAWDACGWFSLSAAEHPKAPITDFTFQPCRSSYSMWPQDPALLSGACGLKTSCKGPSCSALSAGTLLWLWDPTPTASRGHCL